MEIFRSQEGQSLLEVLIALTIIVIIMSGIFPLLGTQILGIVDSQDRIEAMYLAREGVQASRAIHSRSFHELLDGIHGLSLTNGSWQWSGSSDQYDKFTRSVTISSPDLVTKQISSQILWTDTSGLQQTLDFTFNALFTDWYQIDVWGNWTDLQLLGQIDIGATAQGNGIDTDGITAFIAASAATGKPKLYSFNVANKSAPVLLQSLDTGDSLNDVVMYGNYIFTAGTKDNEELRVFDASNPSSMIPVTVINLSLDAKKLIIQNTSLFVVAEQTLFIFDIGNPAAPTLLSSSALASAGNDIDVVNDRAYIATGADISEVQIFDISNFSSPVLIDSIDIVGIADALSLNAQENFIIIGMGSNSAGAELFLYDITDPFSPILRSAVEQSNDVMAIEFAIPYVFIGTADANEELKIYDFRDTQSPVKIDFINLSQLVRDMIMKDNTLYATVRSQDSLKIIGPSL
ncbi:MAG: prepilin-type N-terminal cleavage/methylation domain-containing protein [Parcubacteria group bacterium]|nr:prepilin-type N-terminal cleavage/methylation domain-containing protein [Parcubacteria group bacterium]